VRSRFNKDTNFCARTAFRELLGSKNPFTGPYLLG
jgi:hypothetical protein